MQAPKISIILPVFNGEKYLRGSMDSILAQSFMDYELIIWDDGSTDGSYKILTDYHDTRIKVFKNNANQGLFKTINLAIRQSQGELIQLWSCDDIMKPHCLQTEQLFHKIHPEIGMSYCARDMIDSSGKIIMAAPYDATPEIIPPKLAAQLMFYYGSIPGNIATVAIKKDVLNDIGLFTERMKQSGDFDMWVRISSKYSIGFIRESLIYLRSHAGQFSRLKGSGVDFIQEDTEIINSLIKRLPPEIKIYAKVYNRWHRYIQYVNYMIYCIMSGDFKTGVNVYRKIRKMDNLFILVSLWLFTIKGRFFKKAPKFY